MRVSVVIPAFNAETTLAATLRSVQRQTWPPLEVVVVDDGSTDRTGDIARAHGATVISKVNGGLAAARNTGIAAAAGDWVTFLDADDLLLPTYLQAMCDLHLASDASLLFTDAYMFTGRLVQKGTQSDGRLPAAWYLSAPAMLQAVAVYNFVFVGATVRRSALAQVGGFDERINEVADWEMWLRLAHQGFSAARTAEPQAMYRRSAGQMSANMPRMKAASRLMWDLIAAEYQLEEEQRRLVVDRQAFWRDIGGTVWPARSAPRRLVTDLRRSRLIAPRPAREALRA